MTALSLTYQHFAIENYVVLHIFFLLTGPVSENDRGGPQWTYWGGENRGRNNQASLYEVERAALFNIKSGL